MRKTFSAVLAVSFLISQAAMAQCARVPETVAFDVMGLKTNLMVTALTCKADERYNAFVIKYRGELQAQEKALSGYFGRVHGRQARTRHDDYVTQLANSQSQVSVRQGSLFCSRNLPTFDEVMGLRGGQDLPEYAAAKSVAQPISAPPCGNTPDRAAPAATLRRTPRRS